MNTTKATDTDNEPKVIGRLLNWAAATTLFAWILMIFGVGWGIEMFGNSTTSDNDYSWLGLPVILISLVTGTFVLMLAAWARAWAAWATDSD